MSMNTVVPGDNNASNRGQKEAQKPVQPKRVFGNKALTDVEKKNIAIAAHEIVIFFPEVKPENRIFGDPLAIARRQAEENILYHASNCKVPWTRWPRKRTESEVLQAIEIFQTYPDSIGYPRTMIIEAVKIIAESSDFPDARKAAKEALEGKQ